MGLVKLNGVFALNGVFQFQVIIKLCDAYYYLKIKASEAGIQNKRRLWPVYSVIFDFGITVTKYS